MIDTVKIKNSIKDIVVQVNMPNFIGSGMVVSVNDKFFVITALHNIPSSGPLFDIVYRGVSTTFSTNTSKIFIDTINDIALIDIGQPAGIKVISIIDTESPPEGTEVVCFGYTYSHIELGNYLRNIKGEISRDTGSKCILDNQTVKGMSGGPVLSEVDGIPYIIGIILASDAFAENTGTAVIRYGNTIYKKIDKTYINSIINGLA